MRLTPLHGTADEVARHVQVAMTDDIDAIGLECAIPLTTHLTNLKAIAKRTIQ
jgi:hypothetical protein